MIKKIWNALIEGRKDAADRKVAHLLQNEFKDESYEYILQMVKEGKIYDRF